MPRTADEIELEKSVKEKLAQLNISLSTATPADAKFIQRQITLKEGVLAALAKSHQLDERMSRRKPTHFLNILNLPGTKSPVTIADAQQIKNKKGDLTRAANERDNKLDSLKLTAKNLNQNSADFEDTTRELAENHRNYFTNSFVSFFKSCFCCSKNDEEQALLNNGNGK